MPRHARSLIALAASAALAAGALAAMSPAGSAAPADARSAALSKLKGDASGALTIRTDSKGQVTFAGVKAGTRLDAPGVTSATSVKDAADAAIARYGAAFGTTRAGTTLVDLGAQPAVVGDVVRYRQEVGGLPVLGGELVVSLGENREMTSILAETSRAATVPAAKVAESAATSTARDAFLKSAGSGAQPTVTPQGRWVLDPSLVDLSPSVGTRTVWRYELRRGPEERRMLLVDDQTGSVLLNVDLVSEALNRIVCNDNDTPRSPALADPAPCLTSTPPARVEGQAPTGVADVDSAYDLAGAVSNTYAGIGVDLTALIGRDIGGGTKALAQTVRFCFTGTCPNYGNAFWNGLQMYYGNGFASADDVVGHEMTHGVTERTSNLIYWGQSGAMNESISDIMGEIVDHQHVNATDSVPGNEWALGEDVPGFEDGGLRDMRDPTIWGNADKTSSPLWVREDAFTFGQPYPDEDGVHSNSGVGNKTFYLISQGGTFNGQTITGIDAADPNLIKSAKLWLLTDQTLSSGSDYADEAAALEQSCATLQSAGVMTAANCQAVHQATLATELRQTPINAAQPADATITCPGTAVPRVLFNSETGDPASKFTAGAPIVDPTGPDGVWNRDGVEGWGPNAKSKPGSWAIADPAKAGSTSLTATNGIALPAGRTSYLHFQHWRVLDYDYGGVAYDGGTVEVDAGAGAVPTQALPWVNGPEQPIFSSTNPANGKKAFGGDSRGYIASRLDLSSFAGKTVKPQFTLNTDFTIGFIGWYVDDIQVYTCDPKVALGKVKAKGKAQVGRKLKAVVKGLQPGATVTYQWLRNGKTIPGATGKKYKLKKGDRGKKVSVAVTASAPTYATNTVASKARKVSG
ncbi:MAG: bacillolysin, partial [Nocardioidaceae bacterium]|nr:bacillolysin [Nocardioidaceae bacterium]